MTTTAKQTKKTLKVRVELLEGRTVKNRNYHSLPEDANLLEVAQFFLPGAQETPITKVDFSREYVCIYNVTGKESSVPMAYYQQQKRGVM